MGSSEGVRTTMIRGLVPVLLCLAALAAFPEPAQAHIGDPPTPGTIWGAWNLDPLLLAVLLAASVGYWRGTSRIWRGAGRGRGVRTSQAIAFGTAMIVLFVAVISPLDALGEALFSAHMVQHLLLILVAAPLLVYARPWLPFLRAMPPAWRTYSGGLFRSGRVSRRLLALLTGTMTAWVLHLVAVWLWHIPIFYEAAVGSWLVHTLEHATFVGAAMLFWWTVLPVTRGAASTRQGLAVLSLFTTALHSGLLSAILTFSAAAWYTSHAETVEAWGLTPLEDQQLAGVIMWVPMGVVYTVTAAAVLIRLLQRLDQEEPESWATSAGDGVTGSS